MDFRGLAILLLVVQLQESRICMSAESKCWARQRMGQVFIPMNPPRMAWIELEFLKLQMFVLIEDPNPPFIYSSMIVSCDESWLGVSGNFKGRESVGPIPSPWETITTQCLRIVFLHISPHSPRLIPASESRCVEEGVLVSEETWAIWNGTLYLSN